MSPKDSCSTVIPVSAVKISNKPSETANESCVRRVIEDPLISLSDISELPQAKTPKNIITAGNFKYLFTIPPLALSRSGIRVNCPPKLDSVLSTRMVRAPRMTSPIVSHLKLLVLNFPNLNRKGVNRCEF